MKNGMEIMNKILVCSTLIICCYQLDINKNQKFYLSKKKIKNCLIKNNINQDIITYIINDLCNIYNIEGKIIYLVNSSDVECMCLQTKDILYLNFCGTQFGYYDPISCIKDLYASICLGQSPLKFIKNSKIKIHSKYQDNMLSDNMLGKICKIVKKNINLNPDLQIIICGHSLGCGYALYTSLYLSNKFKSSNIELVTLCATKMANKKLNKFLATIKNIYHLDIINKNDIVPFYPPVPNYTHIAKKIILLDSDKYDIIKSKNLSRNILQNNSLKDHFISSIMSNIWNNLE